MDFEGRERIKMGLNLVPLINVIFLLLIFFMLAGTMEKPEPFEVETPLSTSSDSDELEPMYEPIEIAVSSSGQIAVNDREIPRSELQAILKEKYNGAPLPAITLRIDAQAETGDLTDIISELRDIGGRLVLLTTHSPKDE